MSFSKFDFNDLHNYVFHIATQTENQYSLIEQSAHSTVLGIY